MMVTFPVKQVWIMLRIWWKLWSSEVQYHTILLQNKNIFYIEYFNPNEFCFWIRNVKQYFSINILSIFMTKRVSVILFILKAFNKKCNSNPNWIKLAKVLKLKKIPKIQILQKISLLLTIESCVWHKIK